MTVPVFTAFTRVPANERTCLSRVAPSSVCVVLSHWWRQLCVRPCPRYLVGELYTYRGALDPPHFLVFATCLLGCLMSGHTFSCLCGGALAFSREESLGRDRYSIIKRSRTRFRSQTASTRSSSWERRLAGSTE